MKANKKRSKNTKMKNMENATDRWVPNVGDHYKTIMWSARLGFYTHDCVWENDKADNEKLEDGNVFRYVSDAQCWCNTFNTYMGNPMAALRDRDKSVDFRGEWIPVSEMLPKKLNTGNGTLTVHCTDGKEIYTGIYDHKYKLWIVDRPFGLDIIEFSSTITHWMPFPDLP